MLSIVTIDVVSGDTRTCKIHLDGCQSLIKARTHFGTGQSARSKALHRIFFYLRVMQIAASYSIAPVSTDNSAQPGETWPDALDFLFEPPPSYEGDLDTASYELIYGFPQSLLVLIFRTCLLLQRSRSMASIMDDGSGNTTMLNYMLSCDQLENDILDWPVDEVVSQVSQAGMDDANHCILVHHIKAFYQAVIIFFCRHIRFMHPKLLRPYVEKVYSHLGKIEEIKKTHRIDSGPILWPAFVAGEQATSANLRSQIIQWFETTERDGIGTATVTRKALEEAWKQDRPSRSMGERLLSLAYAQLILT